MPDIVDFKMCKFCYDYFMSVYNLRLSLGKNILLSNIQQNFAFGKHKSFKRSAKEEIIRKLLLRTQ